VDRPEYSDGAIINDDFEIGDQSDENPSGSDLRGALAAGTSNASTLYGGLGGHGNGDSTNDGSIALVNQVTGAVTVIGHPAGVSRISGLAFDQNGMLFATTQPGGGFPSPPGPRVVLSAWGIR
jgi:hypothetical protein